MAKRKTPSVGRAVNVTKTAKTVAKKIFRDQRKRKPRYSGLLAILVLLGCFLLLAYDQVVNGVNSGESTNEEYGEYDNSELGGPDDTLTGGILSLNPGTYRVKHVVDGDTLVLDGSALGADRDVRPKIRLLGVDTPETVKRNHPVEPFGPEASAYTKKRIAENQNVVRLEFDRNPTDKYGRFLAYVWLGDSLLNEELLFHGLARTTPEFTTRRDAQFSRAEQEAKRQRKGIWGMKGASR